MQDPFLAVAHSMYADRLMQAGITWQLVEGREITRTVVKQEGPSLRLRIADVLVALGARLAPSTVPPRTA